MLWWRRCSEDDTVRVTVEFAIVQYLSPSLWPYRFTILAYSLVFFNHERASFVLFLDVHFSPVLLPRALTKAKIFQFGTTNSHCIPHNACGSEWASTLRPISEFRFAPQGVVARGLGPSSCWALLFFLFGHAMDGPPKEEYLAPFVINTVDPLNPAGRKVRQAWNKIVRNGPELGKKNVIAREPYVQWEKERARVVKIPFYYESSSLPQVPEPEPILQEDVNKLTSKISELKLENTRLRLQLIKEKQGGDDLEDEGKEVKALYETSKKRAREKKVRKSGPAVLSGEQIQNLMDETMN
ncbi:hypothetical protein KIW84_070156 [Lathyrus oleraceus]|uniref:DUF7745 domain-containing protein n=1 Tax=Pisum sativum TaxID=3888 RepID=A0A9D4VFZ3_PEA|nr:hypothetical protein KIW84_070156 [Pisum sativum]